MPMRPSPPLPTLPWVKTYGCDSFASLAITPELNLRADYTLTIATDEVTQLELLRRLRQWHITMARSQ